MGCLCNLEHLKGIGVKLELLLLQDTVVNTAHCFFIFIFIALIFSKVFSKYGIINKNFVWILILLSMEQNISIVPCFLGKTGFVIEDVGLL